VCTTKGKAKRDARKRADRRGEEALRGVIDFLHFSGGRERRITLTSSPRTGKDTKNVCVLLKDGNSKNFGSKGQPKGRKNYLQGKGKKLINQS